MPIRILHIVTYMGRGGLETMLMNYYRHIDRNKVQFDFLVHRDFEADYDTEILALGGRIYRLPPLNPVNRHYLSALDHFFFTHKEYRIVHCHLDCMAGIPLKYAKKHGIPVRIAHAHSSRQTTDHKYLLKLIYKRNIPLYANQLFACSEAAGKWMFGKHGFQVLNNAIDAKQFIFSSEVRDSVRKEFHIGVDALVIGHVGNFMAPKNHDQLLRIFAKLPTAANLLLVGDGALKRKIEHLAESLGIRDRVIFTGLRKDIDRLLQAMDVFVFPSLFEGLGIAAIEAQAAGLPSLISDHVPMECAKTDLVRQLKLTDPPEVWATAILNAAKSVRRNTYEQIKAAGFDIETNAAYLQEYYMEAQEHANADHIHPSL